MNLRIVRLAYWLIRLRWFAILGIFIAYYLAKHSLHITISDLPVYIIILLLILLNVLSISFLKYLQKSQIRKSLKNVKRIINFQISTDLIVLTVLLHYSGGVENPFIIYYIFHMIIGSIMLTTKESFVQTSFALLLLGSMTFLEYSGIIQHYPLQGFITSNMYNNLTYLACTGFIFISTSYFVVYITRTIIKQSEKHEAAYLLANAKLKQKDKIKNEYVMRITHDIKGHITAIQRCISVLNEKLTGPLNSQQEEFVNRAHKRIQILNKFISDLLSITNRKLLQKTEKKYFSLKNSIEEIIKMSENSVQEKNIGIIKNIEASVDNIYGEQSSIEEVLSNLIQNAIKYSPAGKNIFINVWDKQENVLIEVIDNGMGIPEYEIPLIFNEFYRASNVKTEIKDGTGLGLAISKYIVENHGGKIWVDSIENLGTTFYLLLKKEE
jgi:signal transduction histidine kinase